MRICLINSFYYPNVIGGAEISTQKLAEGLVQKGYSVDVISIDRENKVEIINGVRVHYIKTINIYNPLDIHSRQAIKTNKLKNGMNLILENYNLLNFINFTKIINEIKPHVVHTNNLYGFSTIIWTICRLKKIPIVHTIRDYHLFEDRKGIYNIRRLFLKYQSKKISIVTAPSNFIMNKFINARYFSKDKFKIIYNAIDYNEKNVMKLCKNKLKLINDEEIINLLYIGRLEKNKGIKLLIDTFISMDQNKFKLNIAGKGELEEYVLAACERANINYLGFLQEEALNEIILKNDILIAPSLWDEPFGRVVLDAYKNCIPIIVSNNGGFPEIVDNNSTGCIIKPEIEDLKNSILHLSNQKLRKKMILNGVKKLQQFSINTQVKEFESIYVKLTSDSNYSD